jgi:hypothetical protein
MMFQRSLSTLREVSYTLNPSSPRKGEELYDSPSLAVREGAGG